MLGEVHLLGPGGAQVDLHWSLVNARAARGRVPPEHGRAPRAPCPPAQQHGTCAGPGRRGQPPAPVRALGSVRRGQAAVAPGRRPVQASCEGALPAADRPGMTSVRPCRLTTAAWIARRGLRVTAARLTAASVCASAPCSVDSVVRRTADRDRTRGRRCSRAARSRQRSAPGRSGDHLRAPPAPDPRCARPASVEGVPDPSRVPRGAVVEQAYSSGSERTDTTSAPSTGVGTW